jgi:archaellum component FlaC
MERKTADLIASFKNSIESNNKEIVQTAETVIRLQKRIKDLEKERSESQRQIIKLLEEGV